MIAGSHVRLDKVAAYNPGLVKPTHWLRGHLVDDVTVGYTMIVDRYERGALPSEAEGVYKTRGLYMSSPVVSIEASTDGSSYLIETKNSVWRLTPLPNQS